MKVPARLEGFRVRRLQAVRRGQPLRRVSGMRRVFSQRSPPKTSPSSGDSGTGGLGLRAYPNINEAFGPNGRFLS